MFSPRNLVKIFVFISISSIGQNALEVEIGVNGLTCSACTRSVEMSLRRLDFVDSVAMSLENTEGKIITKGGDYTDFERIAKAVTDAGFSVRFLQINIPLTAIEPTPDGCFTFEKYFFQLIDYDGKQKKYEGIGLVDEAFLPGKEFKRWKNRVKGNNCFPDKRVFHVTHELR